VLGRHLAGAVLELPGRISQHGVKLATPDGREQVFGSVHAGQTPCRTRAPRVARRRPNPGPRMQCPRIIFLCRPARRCSRWLHPGGGVKRKLSAMHPFLGDIFRAPFIGFRLCSSAMARMRSRTGSGMRFHTSRAWVTGPQAPRAHAPGSGRTNGRRSGPARRSRPRSGAPPGDPSTSRMISGFVGVQHDSVAGSRHRRQPVDRAVRLHRGIRVIPGRKRPWTGSVRRWLSHLNAAATTR
jgi:hypothetical protein